MPASGTSPRIDGARARATLVDPSVPTPRDVTRGASARSGVCTCPTRRDRDHGGAGDQGAPEGRRNRQQRVRLPHEVGYAHVPLAATSITAGQAIRSLPGGTRSRPGWRGAARSRRNPQTARAATARSGVCTCPTRRDLDHGGAGDQGASQRQAISAAARAASARSGVCTCPTRRDLGTGGKRSPHLGHAIPTWLAGPEAGETGRKRVRLPHRVGYAHTPLRAN